MVIEYKGYEIRPASMHLKDKDEWSVTVYIKKHSESCATFKPFSSGNTFNTKEEANRHSIEFAKRIIDGKHANLTLSGL